MIHRTHSDGAAADEVKSIFRRDGSYPCSTAVVYHLEITDDHQRENRRRTRDEPGCFVSI